MWDVYLVCLVMWDVWWGGTFSDGMFWEWDVLSCGTFREWDISRAGPLVMGRFESGTFQELDLPLVMGRFENGTFQELDLLYVPLILCTNVLNKTKYSKNLLVSFIFFLLYRFVTICFVVYYLQNHSLSCYTVWKNIFLIVVKRNLQA
jgi:hypothetical protein